ncbi:MAG TPA: LuxR C-terminal-related transcriptional regulator [Gaiellaceae bacterium]
MAGIDSSWPLAEAKLASPRLRSDLLERRRVLQAFDAGVDPALTLVAAPPGYGKTTAARAWWASTGSSLAWVNLDAGDNDPVRLWTYVATAVDRVREGLGRSALQRLSVPGAPIESAVDELTNGLSSYGEQIALVLDDFQDVTDPDCLLSVDYALEHLPDNARVVVITRTDPALQLGRLRAAGALAEVRAGELAFTEPEAHQLLVERGGLKLDRDDVGLLHERTEGWPAALFLALLWLRPLADPQRAIQEFSSQQRFVADYLTEEVFNALGEDARWLLLRASVLGQFTAALCDGVLGRSDSAAVLAELERSNLFVIRLERGGWFRVHALLAEFAGSLLEAEEPGATIEIRRRASEWLRSQGLPVEAVENAAAAGDDELVAQLLEEQHLTLIRNGGARTLLRWAQTLPDQKLLEHPRLAAVAATAAAMVGRQTIEKRRLLRLADRAEAQQPEPDPYVEAVAGMVRAASVDDDVAWSVSQGRRAVERARDGADDVLVAALAGYARALYLAGDLDAAWSAALEAVEHPEAERRTPGHALARTTLALVGVDRGRLASARAHAEKARSLVGGIGDSRSWLGANAAIALGVVLMAEGKLAEAERELAQAEGFFRDEIATVQDAWLLVLLARVRCRRGRLAEAATALGSAREELAELADGGRVQELAAGVQLELEEATARAGSGEVLETPSNAELAVLRFLATDLSTREIGSRLYISPNTVRSHARSIYRKLGVNSRIDAIARAAALGLLEQSESPR